MIENKSLKQNLNADDKINEIKLALNSALGQNTIWLLVEGVTDCKVYSKFVSSTSVSVEQVHGGNLQLEKAIKELNKVTEQVLGIRDADFMHLEKNYNKINNLFYTDYHDIEMTMLSFESVRSNLYSEHKLTGTDNLWSNLLIASSFTGYIRWFNDRNNTSLNFKGFKFGDSITKSEDYSITIDKEKIIEHINIRSKNRQVDFDLSLIEEYINDNKTSDLLNLCNGHDTVELLSDIIGSSVSSKELDRHIRLSFRIEEFSQTMLYKHLQDWEIKTGFKLLANE